MSPIETEAPLRLADQVTDLQRRIDVLSEDEIEAELDLARWTRAQDRQQRRKTVEAEVKAADRERRNQVRISRKDQADQRWHQRAHADRKRRTDPHANLARMHRLSEWSSRVLICVVLVGMTWAAFNVQHNLDNFAAGDTALSLLSYGVEAMISIPLVVIMVVATTAAGQGEQVERHKIIAFELALLATTVSLNSGPHLVHDHYLQAVEFGVAPVMVGVEIWIHAWVSNRYAALIARASVLQADADTDPASHVEEDTSGDGIDPDEAASGIRQAIELRLQADERLVEAMRAARDAGNSRNNIARQLDGVLSRGVVLDILAGRRSSA